MAQRRSVIKVPNGNIQKIMSELNVKRSCVYSALNYSSNSEIAQKIRRVAMSDYGGVTATKVFW